MSAWTRLLAASSLAIGSAWDLITHPRTGGSGVVVNNGIAVSVSTDAFTVALDNASRQIAVSDGGMAVTVADNQITASFAPSLTVQITTNQIGAST